MERAGDSPSIGGEAMSFTAESRRNNEGPVMSRMHHPRRYSSLPVLSWLENEMRKAQSAVKRAHRKLDEARSEAAGTDDAVLTAGDALRGAELEAAQGDGEATATTAGSETKPDRLSSSTPVAASRRQRRPSSAVHRNALEQLSIDDLRELAFSVQVPDRSVITEKATLIDEICKRL
jgi:hypothetical protein